MEINPLIQKKKPEKIIFYVRYFKLLAVVLFLIILIPGYFFVIKPQKDAHNTDRAVYQEKETILDNETKKLIGLKSTSANFTTINHEQVKKVDEILPTGIDLPSLYINLEAIAKKAGITLQDFTIEAANEAQRPISKKSKQTTDEEQLIKHKISPDSVRGELKEGTINASYSNVNYSRLKNFFEIIENNLRLMDIKSFSFNPADGQVEISLTVYYLE